MSGPDILRDTARLLRFLRFGTATLSQAAAPNRLLLACPDHGSISMRIEVLERALRKGSIVRNGDLVKLTDDGHAQLRRLSSPDAPCSSQHRIESHEIRVERGEAIEVTVNAAESPLSLLRRRKGPDGRPFLALSEFAAGERLRADFTRASLMPRVTASWQARVSSGRRSAGVGDLTDAALAARLRVERAMAAVGPELSGVLIDICCFLKGLETVERERQWPQRSAKVLLKTALAALDRHYQPSKARRSSSVLHWGSEDYRPKIGAG